MDKKANNTDGLGSIAFQEGMAQPYNYMVMSRQSR